MLCFFQQNLMFSALTRLPHEMTAVQKRALVEDVLVLLGLTELRHSPIGDEGMQQNIVS